MKRYLILPLVFLLACSDGDKDARVDPGGPPSGVAFRPVAQVLLERCGSIDCHGSKYRNMRLFGFASERLDLLHRPDAPETTDAEVDRDYDAVVALEPEVLRQVVAEGGINAQRLTFVRKGEGYEAHKGGQRILPGEDADLCIKSWLAGTVDAPRCKSAVPRLNDP